MIEDAAVGVAVIGSTGKVCRLIALRQIPSHGDGHGISQNDGRQKRQRHVAQKRVGAAFCRQALYPGPADHNGQRIQKDQEQKHLGQKRRDPGKELVRPRIYHSLDSIYQKHKKSLPAHYNKAERDLKTEK